MLISLKSSALSLSAAMLIAVLAAPLPAQCRTGKLSADQVQAFAQFGRAVAISGDRIVVGAPNGKANGVATGVAYVFHRGPAGFAFESELSAADGAEFDEFGISVAIDGDTILVGADGIDSLQSGAMGAVYAFERVGSQWVNTQRLQAADGASGGFFGCSVALQGDVALVGRYWDNAPAMHTGSAYVFRRSGSTWTQAQKLLHAHGAVEDMFGWAVALSGARAVVSASERFSGFEGDPQLGHVYVFTEQAGSYVQTAVLGSSTPQPHDQFGISVDIDGDEIAVGAWQDFFSPQGSGNGEAFVFDWNGSAWVQSQKLVAADGALQEEYGSAVAIQGDRLLVGAASRNGFPLWGGVYAYQRTGGSFAQTALFLPDAGSSLEWMGNAVAMDGNDAVAGAFIETVGVVQSGAAYVLSGFAAWSDLGAGLAGAGGAPVLTGSGTLCPGSANALNASGAAPSSPATLVFGLTQLGAPFKGGTLVPTPQVLVPLVTNTGGVASLPFTMPPHLPGGVPLLFQLWVQDAGGPAGFAASNGLRGVTP